MVQMNRYCISIHICNRNICILLRTLVQVVLRAPDEVHVLLVNGRQSSLKALGRGVGAVVLKPFLGSGGEGFKFRA